MKEKTILETEVDPMQTEVSQKIHDNFTKYPKRSYPKGQIIIFAEENPEYVYYIVSGKIRMYDHTYRGDEIILNMFATPAFFPMTWAINKTNNKYFYKAETDVALHIVPAHEALDFVKENPDVLFDLLARVYKGMDGVLGRMVHLMSGTARSRVIHELIIESRRFGEHQTDGSLLLHITESDLAARCGLSRETISREIKKLKTKKWITLSSKTLRVNELSQLEQALGAEI